MRYLKHPFCALENDEDSRVPKKLTWTNWKRILVFLCLFILLKILAYCSWKMMIFIKLLLLFSKTWWRIFSVPTLLSPSHLLHLIWLRFTVVIERKERSREKLSILGRSKNVQSNIWKYFHLAIFLHEGLCLCCFSHVTSRVSLPEYPQNVSLCLFHLYIMLYCPFSVAGY